MIEAKAQLKHGEFGPWVARNFKIGARQARLYMSLATTEYKTRSSTEKAQYEHRAAIKNTRGGPDPWREDVKEKH